MGVLEGNSSATEMAASVASVSAHRAAYIYKLYLASLFNHLLHIHFLALSAAPVFESIYVNDGHYSNVYVSEKEKTVYSIESAHAHPTSLWTCYYMNQRIIKERFPYVAALNVPFRCIRYSHPFGFFIYFFLHVYISPFFLKDSARNF